MSKRSLEQLLKQIETKVQTARQDFNTEIHKYSVVYSSILREVHTQVTLPRISFPIDIFEELVKNYCNTLYTGFKTYTGSAYSIRVLGSPQSFFVLVTPTKKGQNVFNAIKMIRRKALDKLKIDIIKVTVNYLKEKKSFNQKKELSLRNNIFGTVDKNNIKSGGLLEMGHAEGSSVIEHELFPARLSFSQNIEKLSVGKRQVVDNILAELDLRMITNPKEHGVLRNGRLVMSIYDQSKKANSVQSNVEQTLRSRLAKAMYRTLEEIDFAELEGSPNVPTIIKAKIHKHAKKIGAKRGIDNKLVAIADKTFKSNASRKIKNKTTINSTSESLKGSINLVSANNTETSSTGRNWASIVAIINRQLHDTIKTNMMYPKLEYRTGRFARSARVVGVVQTNEGYPSFIYDYQRNPYDVFDITKGASPWATPDRDPKSLVTMSIREILTEMAIGRYYLRRA